MEPQLLCIFFWAVLAVLAYVLSEGNIFEARTLSEHDIFENKESSDWPWVLFLIFILIIIIFAFYHMVVSAGEICIGFGQTCS
tara:strand:+ start:153 stop:401 length:249 start_codon:yes stop_codon:yes gene_type:complete